MPLLLDLIKNLANTEHRKKDSIRNPIIRLIKKPKAKLNEKNEYGYTSLHLAAWDGHEDICRLLIDNGANVNEKNKDGEIPLHCAAWDGHEDICQLLIENGANVNEKNKDGEIPLECADKYGRKKTVKLLKAFSYVFDDTTSTLTLPLVIKRYNESFFKDTRPKPFPTLTELAAMKIKSLHLNSNDLEKILPVEILDKIKKFPLFFNKYVEQEEYILTSKSRSLKRKLTN